MSKRYRYGIVSTGAIVAVLAIAPAAARAGDGMFLAPEATSVQLSGPSAFAVGDFNSDGDPDLAIANGLRNELSIRPGGPGAAFPDAEAISLDANSSSDVAVGDFNADGDEDLAAVHLLAGEVSIWVGGPGATFPNAQSFSFSVGLTPTALAVGDFNADGDHDLAILSEHAGTVTIRPGSTEASFPVALEFKVSLAGSTPNPIAVGDFNLDADEDLAVTDSSGNNVAILVGGTAATFTPSTLVAAGQDPSAIASGDFNADGDEDLAIASSTDKTVTIRAGASGNNDGGAADPFTFGQVLDVSSVGQPTGVAVADFNSDGDEDLAVRGNLGRILIRLGGPGISFPDALSSSFGSSEGYFGDLTVGDFNSDGIQDVGALSFHAGEVSIHPGDGLPLLAGNLLINGGAEDGVGTPIGANTLSPPGWTTSGAMTSVRYSSEGGFPKRHTAQGWEGGEDFFAGGPTSGESTATQTASVAGDANEIDKGGVTASLTADLGGYRLVNDRMSVSAEFLDASGATLGSFSVGPVTATDRSNLTRFLRRAASASVPAGTRSIRVTLLAHDADGAYNNAYADNVQLRLTVPTPPDTQPDETTPADPAAPTLCRSLEATVVGTEGAERLFGIPGDDVIAALGGADKVLASAGNDIVCGGTGKDSLKGQGGRDRLYGEGSRDALIGGSGSGDLCVGGPGADRSAGSCERARR